MKKRILAVAFAAALLLTGCGGAPQEGSEEGNLSELTVCLDWTPNTNHTGMFVAQSLGYYRDAGLKVTVEQPPEDGATALVAAGQAEFGVTVQDSLAAAFARDNPLQVTAVAALLQHNTSGIISRKGEGMDIPKGLEGHTYSTWNSPIEQAIMRQVIAADGGDFDRVILSSAAVTDEAGALRAKQTDAIWVYYGWAGISAKLSGLEFDYFYFKDIDPVFDYYTPVLIANNEFLDQHPETAKAFLAATEKGYRYAVDHPDKAAQILIESDDTGSLNGSEDLVRESQAYMVDQYIADAKQWGYIDPERWDAFYAWLTENGLVDRPLPAGTGFSNGYLSK